MGTMEPELFGRLVVEIHAHVQYRHHEGWVLWISRRHEGTPFTDGVSESYGPMQLEELLSVLDPILSTAYLGSRYQDHTID